MTMQNWIDALDNQIVSNRRKLLEGKGRVSHKQAVEKAEKEFEIYRAREMKQLESDFDRAVKLLQQQYEKTTAAAMRTDRFYLYTLHS